MIGDVEALSMKNELRHLELATAYCTLALIWISAMHGPPTSSDLTPHILVRRHKQRLVSIHDIPLVASRHQSFRESIQLYF